MKETIYCPTCGKPAKTYEEAEDIRGLGECLRCDHVRGDYLSQVRDLYLIEESEQNDIYL